MGSVVLSCRNLYKSFGKSKVISNLSVDFQKGSTLLTGANSSGKSTLLMLISGIESLDSGELIFLNAEKNKSSISTDSIMEPDVFTLYEILKLHRTFNETNNELFELLISELNLSQFLHYRINKVSTGTRKKFSVLSALVKNSNLLMLDEPFNGLDHRSREVLREVILNDNRNKIIVDHDNVLPFDNLVSL
jgi:ABC-type multidrug transport system ATPase subunit